MNLVPSDRFYALFEQMVEEMNNIENFDRDRFVAVLTQLSELFRISKGVTEFYTNENREKIGEGEIIIDFDNGKGGPAIIYHRIVTKSQAVIKGTIYRAEDEEPLSECDLKRLDLIVLQLLSFVARNRLASAIEALGFYDDFGYKNRRAFFRQVENLYGQNKLTTKDLEVEQQTNYPWDGHITLTIKKAKRLASIRMHIPGWATDMTLKLNGEPILAEDLRQLSGG